jgi:predicted dienelactone hydrolase
MRIAAMTLLLAALAAAAPRAAAAEFTAGFRETSFTEPASGETVPLTIWYPAHAAESRIEIGSFVMFAARQVPRASGKHGLVLVSHGDGGNRLGYRDIALALARRGYVVAAPLHARNTARDNSAAGSAALFASRPREVSAALDFVLADAALGRAIDPERIGVLGHSLGGYTALALVGGRPTVAAIVAHCAAHDDPVCLRRGRREGSGERPDETPFPPLRDARIRAAVVMAPMLLPFAPGALGAVDVPLRAYLAEHDTVTLNRYHGERLLDELPRAPEVIRVAGAGHFSFLSPFPAALRGRVGGADEDPPGFDRAAFHAQLGPEIADFFDTALRR